MATDARAIAGHWGRADLYESITAALGAMGKPLDAVTVEDLALVDHFHARGLAATMELADRLPIEARHHILDIGCGLGGPARYLAKRFGCRVSGVDITESFVEVGRRLNALVGMEGRVRLQLGDGNDLPFAAEAFDGAISQHVTMNVADRARFFAEAWRVLRPGAFFALTEHGLGAGGAPHYPLPWSEDGSGSFLLPPERTRELLLAAGFEEVHFESTGAKYLAGYRASIARAEAGTLPPLGTGLLMDNALGKTRNAARNIVEERTHPIEVVCRKPARG